MLLPQLFRAGPGPGPLGAVDLSLPLAAGKDLSVKEYAGGIWASYQSLAANQILRELNQALRKLGFTNIPLLSGVIDNRTVEAVKLVATFASNPAYAGLALPSGGTVGYAGTFLRRYTNAKAIAKDGVQARYYINSLTDSSYFKTLMQYVLTNRPPPAPPPSSPTPTPQPQPSPPTSTTTPMTPSPTFDPNALTTSAEPGFFQKKSTVWYIVGGILFAGAATAAYLVWKE